MVVSDGFQLVVAVGFQLVVIVGIHLVVSAGFQLAVMVGLQLVVTGGFQAAVRMCICRETAANTVSSHPTLSEPQRFSGGTVANKFKLLLGLRCLLSAAVIYAAAVVRSGSELAPLSLIHI